jgi:hypothetical protein
LPRRLGDDPLTKARSKRAKAVEGSTSVALDSGGEQSTAQVGIQTASRASYNDVFFQRRGEGISPPPVAGDVLVAPEAPEISEISEIPEIREVVAASGNQSAFDVTADINTVSEVAQHTHIAPAPSVSITEEVVAKLNSQVSATGPAPEVKTEPASPPASSHAPANGGDESKPEPQKSSGFFKRLFGKFK